MTRNEFEKMYVGSFKPDERIIELEDRLRQYYRDTPDSMPNHIARNYWLGFKLWCMGRGYTNEEINRAKRSVNI